MYFECLRPVDRIADVPRFFDEATAHDAPRPVAAFASTENREP